MDSYKRAIDFLAGCKYVCEDSYQLVAHLFGTPIAVVRFDVQQARGKR